MNNWGVETQNSSSINQASEISDISFAWIIVNSHESITVPCATKNRVLINQWGCSRVKTGVDAARLRSFLFFRTAQCPCLSSIIILRNSLIDFCATTDGGGTADLEQLRHNRSKMNVHSSHLDFVEELWCTKRRAFFFYRQHPWLEYFRNDGDLFCVYANNGRRFLPISLHVERKHNPFEMAWRSSLPIALVTAQQSVPPCVATLTPRTGPLFSAAPKAFADEERRAASLMHRAQEQTGSSAHNHNGRPHPIPIAFLLTGGERSRGAYYCGWGKFSWNGRGDGKGSPLTLIWANNTHASSLWTSSPKNGF